MTKEPMQPYHSTDLQGTLQEIRDRGDLSDSEREFEFRNAHEWFSSGWGGKREGAGRKASGTTYQAGYQAGYKAGKREPIVKDAPKPTINADILLLTCDYGDLRHRAVYEVREREGVKGVLCCAEHLAECQADVQRMIDAKTNADYVFGDK